eukprot:SAG11_NODE_1834_length_4188_cov_3.990218_2_plen_127_part_00
MLDKVRTIIRVINAVQPRSTQTMAELDRMEDEPLMDEAHNAVESLLQEREQQMAAAAELRKKLANAELARQQEMAGLRRQLEEKDFQINKMKTQMETGQGAYATACTPCTESSELRFKCLSCIQVR